MNIALAVSERYRLSAIVKECDAVLIPAATGHARLPRQARQL